MIPYHLHIRKNQDISVLMRCLSPLIAIIMTMVCGGFIFYILGHHPLHALYLYFIDPLLHLWSLQELTVKAIPLILIATGLIICFRAQIWNIGAEGQLILGAIFGSSVAIMYPDWNIFFTTFVMIILGILGGALWAAIPAYLKLRFHANEILTSLMLVYIAQLLLDWLIRGVWKDPKGFNFPKSITFTDWQLLPVFGDGRLHLGIVFALLAAIIMSIILYRSYIGYRIVTLGLSQGAGRYAGFSQRKNIWLCLLTSGGLAGLAGISIVMGTIHQLQPSLSPGYGFTAIIVAFLARLNPIAAIFMGFLLALSYLGGETVQFELNISQKIANVFQGLLLFFVLLSDSIITYRFSLVKKTYKMQEGL